MGGENYCSTTLLSHSYHVFGEAADGPYRPLKLAMVRVHLVKGKGLLSLIWLPALATFI